MKRVVSGFTAASDHGAVYAVIQWQIVGCLTLESGRRKMRGASRFGLADGSPPISRAE
jgi:hypothetical protein